MIPKRTRGLALAAVLAMLLPGAEAMSQSGEGTNLGDAPPPATQGVKGKRGKQNPIGTDLKSSDSDSNAARKIALEETKLEKRKAKIARLRELATAQGNQQRLRALDDLEQRLIAGHDRKVAKWRERLGDERYAKVRQKVKKRKGKSGENGKGKGGEHGKGKPAEHGKGKPAEHGKGKPAEHGKGKSAEHGKGKPAEHGKGKPAEHGKGKAAEPGKGKNNAKGAKGKGKKP